MSVMRVGIWKDECCGETRLPLFDPRPAQEAAAGLDNETGDLPVSDVDALKFPNLA
jgi:hypothetical protein